MINNILNHFGTSIKNSILHDCNDFSGKIEEIRIRVNNPIIVKYEDKEKIIDYIINQKEITGILQSICENSIYSYQNQMCEGFITLNGGHRVGITGNVVVKDNKVININYIYSLNFRIANQIKDCSNNILPYLIDNKSIRSTLIVSPPGAGKTTILRDLVLNISNGIPNLNFDGINVSVIDERGEITGMHNGIPQNDIGIRTDILYNVPKVLGMKMAIRSMAPKVIVADEIGNKNDAEIINYAICSGVKGIFTAHGNDMNDLLKNPELSQLIKLNIFENIIFLDELHKGKIKYIQKTERKIS